MAPHTRTRASVARVAAALCVVLAATFIAPPAAHAWTVDTTGRTEAEMRAKWEQLRPAYSATPYAVAPSIVAPYAPGDAAPGFRTDGLNMINFGRYLAGLPADVRLDATRNANGQYGSVLLRVIGFSHAPSPKPADMDQAFYDRGKAATGSSNIGAGYSDSESFQKGCLDDAESTNLPRVGHRRWLLNPRMLVTGIGFVDNYHTTYAFDSSRPAGEVDYSFVAWPSPGVFPVEFCTSRTPWSITLNPAKYFWTGGYTVTMRRVADGATWVFDGSDTNTSGEYFNADFGGYGVANAFIFRPNPASISYKPGDQFDITLSGGIFDKATGGATTITYRTSFGALTGPTTGFSGTVDPDPGASPAPDPGKASVFRFYNKKNGSHFYTASASERDAVIQRYAATYAYEGVAYTVDTQDAANCSPLYRFYNKSNGGHFYTASESEKDAVVARLSGTYVFEGPAYNVSLAGIGSEMYRFYNRSNGSHFYTISAAERDTVRATLGHIYAYEGAAFCLVQ